MTASGDMARAIDVVLVYHAKAAQARREAASNGEEEGNSGFGEYRKQSEHLPSHQERTLGAHPVGDVGKSVKCGPESHSSSKLGGPERKSDGQGARACRTSE